MLLPDCGIGKSSEQKGLPNGGLTQLPKLIEGIWRERQKRKLTIRQPSLQLVVTIRGLGNLPTSIR
jgi:hypothetical protein